MDSKEKGLSCGFVILVLLLSLDGVSGQGGVVNTNRPPTFVSTKPPAFKAFYENITIGTHLFVLEGTDVDGDNSKITFSSDKPDLFTISCQCNPANVTLRSKLDHETQSTVTVVFTVTDEHGLSTTTQTLIPVNDVNDEPPRLNKNQYKVSVNEDISNGSMVLNFASFDKDPYQNANVKRYYLEGELGVFSVTKGSRNGHETNGSIVLNGTLDYETKSYYQFTLVAVDEAGHNDTAEVIITIEDTQDKDPIFLNVGTYNRRINESLSVDTLVTTVTAIDGDRGVQPENKICFSFVKGNDVGNFKIGPYSGNITVKNPLNVHKNGSLNGYYALTVMAQETAGNTCPVPGNSANSTYELYITVLDVNDNPPIFTRMSYRANVSENTPTGSAIYFDPPIEVSDEDQGQNAQFSLSLNSSAFEVVPTGKIIQSAYVTIKVKNQTVLDYENQESIWINVTAIETGSSSSGSSALIVLSIVNVNDNLPQFSQGTYIANISEASSNGTYITNVMATDKDKGYYGEIKYSIQTSQYSSRFRIDSDTGRVFVKEELDREKLSAYYLTVMANDGGGSISTAQLQITLLDANDNIPKFERPSYTTSVNEGEDKLPEQVIVKATDIDIGPNGDIEYSILLNFNDSFSVNQSSGELTLKRAIDYEELNSSEQTNGVIVTVIAKDLGSPSLYSSVNVTVTVDDINDNSPVFKKNLYSTSIYENRTEGDVIRVTASDRDKRGHRNSKLSYSIESKADNFIINSDNGEISVAKGATFDRDIKSFYTIKVGANDKGFPQQSTISIVNITLLDNNNKPPEFYDCLPTEVLENAAMGDLITSCSAFDKDTDQVLNYSLSGISVKFDGHVVPNNSMDMFIVNATTGNVTINGELDRELFDRAQLKILVEDLNAQNPSLQEATATLEITIQDINDNIPMFSKPSYNTTIPETSPIFSGTASVLTVTATDRDKDQDIRYCILPGSDASMFEIDQSRGVILLTKAADRENKSTLTFQVQANDTGSPPLTSNVTVVVQLEDINDNTPEFVDFKNQVNVTENSSNGTAVISINATDKDIDDNGKLDYYIQADGYSPFKINPTTGDIYISYRDKSDTIDRESQSEYVLNVVVQDSGRPRRSSPRTRLTVVIVDENDNTPQFSDANSNKLVDVLEDEGTNYTVVRITATDRDTGSNADINYAMTSLNVTDPPLFKMNIKTGEVSVASSLKKLLGTYHLNVSATDNGASPRSNSTLLYIEVKDVNDNKPVFEKPKSGLNEIIQIFENVSSNVFVYKVVAKDADIGDNGEVEYSLEGSDAANFTINKQTGDIRTSGPTDRETKQLYTLTVRATDKGTPDKQDSQTTFQVKIIDVNDNLPTFSRTELETPYLLGSILEESLAPPVKPLKTVNKAQDKDEDAVICYFIVGGSGKDYFKCNPKTGEIITIKQIDRERFASLDLVIEASDVSSECTRMLPDKAWDRSNAGLLLVKINVDDVNDNPPQFKKTSFSTGVTKEVSIKDTAIFTLGEYVTDLDTANNSNKFQISGTISSRPDELVKKLSERGINIESTFTIDQTTGVIKAKAAFQADMFGYFSFLVTVSDSLGQSDNASISIYLVGETQQVKFTVLGTPDEFEKIKDVFKEALGNITGFLVNIDTIRSNKDETGQDVATKTDVFVHMVDRRTQLVLDGKKVLENQDKMLDSLSPFYKKYSVLAVALPNKQVKENPWNKDTIIYILIVVCLSFFLLFIVTSAVFCTYRRKYTRKLRAATAMAFDKPLDVIGSRDHLSPVNMPNTNVFEGQNPIFGEFHNDQYHFKDDTESDTRSVSGDSDNSLDMNEVEYVENDTQQVTYLGDTLPQTKLPSEVANSTMFLDAALKKHELAKNRKNNNLNKETNHSTSSSQNSKQNGNINNQLMTFSNPNYDAVHKDVYGSTVIIDGLETTEI